MSVTRTGENGPQRWLFDFRWAPHLSLIDESVQPRKGCS
ncbi:MAG: hypothetical protein JWQ26_210 [Modestobacter sp.]|jgi:hypothetical protein|nr:hypothetical protein [Modestobacter sp.]